MQRQLIGPEVLLVAVCSRARDLDRLGRAESGAQLRGEPVGWCCEHSVCTGSDHQLPRPLGRPPVGDKPRHKTLPQCQLLRWLLCVARVAGLAVDADGRTGWCPPSVVEWLR